VNQALQFIFKRDSQFKSWLEQNPETSKPVRSKTSSKRLAFRPAHYGTILGEVRSQKPKENTCMCWMNRASPAHAR
jgi:hypothetical protein